MRVRRKSTSGVSTMATDYDIIVVGGGIAGSALAANMAQEGARTLVLEREERFRDRIRGEYVFPWGMAEAQSLGIVGALEAAGAHSVPSFEIVGMGPPRDLSQTTMQGVPSYGFYHPAAQEALVEHAETAGAEVNRGARVTSVLPGDEPAVRLRNGGDEATLRARLVVGADGRSSLCRKALGKEETHIHDGRLLAGVLLDNVKLEDEHMALVGLIPGTGAMTLVFPQGGGRARSYIADRGTSEDRLQGPGAFDRFVQIAASCGISPNIFENAEIAGPLGTFAADDSWVDHPYADGVALIGDAAGISDPTWGQGLSVGWRDVRVLRDQLCNSDDWDAAGHAYADVHDEYFGRIITAESWQQQMFLDSGPEADERRARALPLLAEDPTRGPDILFSGPDLPVNEEVRRRFFGEDQLEPA